MPPRGYVQAKLDSSVESDLRLAAEVEQNSIARVAGRLIREGLARLARENRRIMKLRDARQKP